MPNAELSLRTLAPDESVAAPARHAERLSALVQTHYDFVWRSVRRLGMPESDVDDVVQKVFIDVSRRLAEVPVGGERSFLFRAALGQTSNAKRVMSRRREVGLEASDDPHDAGPGPEELADRRRAREVAERILNAMPLELRAVFILFEAEGMSTPEIAETLGIPVGTAASRLRRAREEAQERLKRLRARDDFSEAKR